MARSETFHLHTPALVSASGALPFFAPTRASVARPPAPFAWTARDHRKHRHRPRQPARPCAPYWNITWCIAVLFTLGSAVWVANAFVVFLPLATAAPARPAAAGWTALVGSTIFEAGSLLLILEAWNRDDVAAFGQAVERIFTDKDDAPALERGPPVPAPQWRWWSADPKYWHELGFVAGVAQLVGASVFWVSGVTALPQVFDVLLKHPAALAALFWAPQVVGGLGFIVSSTLYMLETQRTWYTPALTSLGWHIGFWNFVGALGFTLCGALGFSPRRAAVYHSALATFWGGWAFLVGSVIQWYEAVHPVPPPEAA